MPSVQITTSTNLADYQKILIAEALLEAEHEAIMENAQLLTIFRLPKGAKQYNLPLFDRLATAAALTEGVALSATAAWTTTTKTLTVSEVGLMIILSQDLIDQSDPNVLAIAGKQLGQSVERKADADILANFDNFGTSLGSAGTAITIGHVTAAIARLKSGLKATLRNPAPDPLNVVLHPIQIRVILNALGTTGTYPIPEGLSAEIVRQYYAANLKEWGVNIWRDGNFSRDANDDVKGGVFSKLSLYLLTGRDYQVKEEEDIYLRARALVATRRYSTGEIFDEYGVEMFFDAANPAS